MNQTTYTEILTEQTTRALWEVKNVIGCIPDDCWDKLYCQMPLWKHVYHMLHSLDLWLINPNDSNYQEPSFHQPGLNSLDEAPTKTLTRSELNEYFTQTRQKVRGYLDLLSDALLLEMPQGCPYTRFTLLVAQHRHLHTHMGMLMGFIVAETGRWPKVLGLEGKYPQEDDTNDGSLA